AFDRSNAVSWIFRRGLQAHFELDEIPPNGGNGKPMGTHGAVQLVPGKMGQAVAFDGQSYLDAGDVGAFGFFDKFTMSAWIYPGNGKGGAILSRMVDTDRAEGYSFMLQDEKLHVNLIKRWLDDAIRVETDAAVPPNQWHHVAFRYDGSRLASGVTVFIDGKPQKLKVNLDNLNQPFAPPEPFRIGAGGASRFHGIVDDVCIYDRALSNEEVALVATADGFGDIISIPNSKRSVGQAHKLLTYYL